MSKSFIKYMDSPIGPLRLSCSETAVLDVSFQENKEANSSDIPPILNDLESQLTLYFDGNLKEFNLLLDPKGTDFQKRVWKELENIPFGKTVSYLDMAKKLGDPKVIRAAASANGKNPISIIIPCHRVIGNNGELTGYAGGLPRKRALLDHENRLANGVLELF